MRSDGRANAVVASDGDGVAPPKDELASMVRRALSGVDNVREKRMFGSLGFMVNGKFCVSARGSRLMCRIDSALHDDLVARRGCSTMKMRGREYRGYVLVDRRAVRGYSDVKFWVGLALDFISTLPKEGGRTRA